MTKSDEQHAKFMAARARRGGKKGPGSGLFEQAAYWRELGFKPHACDRCGAWMRTPQCRDCA